MRGGTFLLGAGLVHLLAALEFPGETEDRLIQAVSPDLYSGGAKPGVRIVEREARFNRASVEAAPDTVEVPTITLKKASPYRRQQGDVPPFSRQFVEAGSLKYYGAANKRPSTVETYSKEEESSSAPVLKYFGAATPMGSVPEIPELNYFGAAAPTGSVPEIPELNYFGAASNSLPWQRRPQLQPQSYRSYPVSLAQSSPATSKAKPLRAAVEKRPAPLPARLLYNKEGRSLDAQRTKYAAANHQEFLQARPDPGHNNARHVARLKQSQPKKADGYKIVCYYGAWSVYREAPFNFGVADIDPFSCTHLIYSFAGLHEDTLTMVSLDKEEDIIKGSYKAAVALKEKNPSLKVLLAIGGWNEGGKKYSAMSATKESRARFIDSAVRLLEEHQFDGLDLDWEYPGATDRDGKYADRANFARLVEELAAEFGRRDWLLSAAVSPAKFRVDEGYDVRKIAQHLDFINVMTYDLHGDWDGFIDHHAPLHSREHDSWEFQSLNSDSGLAYWHSQGAPREKLLLGTPFYGRTFTLSSVSANKPGDRSRGPGDEGVYTKEAGFMAYHEICQLIKDGGWTQTKDSDGNPYIYKDNQWIGFDTVENVRRKMEYVKTKGLGGAMIWAIDLDDYQGVCGTRWPLLTNMNLILRPQGGVIEPETEDSEVELVDTVVDTAAVEEDPWLEEEEETENFICTGTGTFRSTTNCRTYYTCMADGTAYRFECPNGLLYDPAIKSCNWPAAVSCPTLYREPVNRGVCANLLDGLYSDPHVANQFFWCTSSRRMQMACPLGLHFDSLTGGCNFPSVARYVPGTIIRVGASSPLTLYNNNDSQKKVVCYFANWAGLREGAAKYVPENIPAQHCSHVVYAFAKLDDEKFVPVPSGPVADIDQDYYARVQATVKARQAEAKVLISVGGWADSAGDKYSRLVNDPALRSKFVQGALDFLRVYNFDGLLLEWHFPVCWQSDCSKGPDSDRAGFSELVTELRAAMGDEFVLGTTLSGYQKVIDKAYDVAALSQQLDIINIMAYDLQGFWDGKTGHHAPLSAIDSSPSVEGVVSQYVAKGADKSKIIVGIPFYGQTFTTRGSGTGYGTPSRGPGAPGAFTKQPGMLSYHEICSNLKRGWTLGGDLGNGPFAADSDNNQWAGFDSPESVRAKAEYVKRMGYGGVSLSTLDLDDFNNLCCLGASPLLGAAAEVLLGTPPAPPGCGRPTPPVTPTPKPAASTEPWDDGSSRRTSSTTRRTTTTTTTTTTWSGPVSSPAPARPAECVEGDYIANSENCQQYFRCVNGEKQRHSCAGGLGWDQVNLRCDWRDKVNCNQRNVLVEDSAAIIIGQLDSLEPADEGSVVEVGVEEETGGGACTGSLQYAPVPGDCTSFYQCMNQQPIKQSCSSGLHFSAEKGLCDWPESAGCSGFRLLEKTPCKEGPFMPDPNDCSAYLVCVHSEYVQFRCQEGTHWDDALKTCNHPDKAGCSAQGGQSGASTPSTTTTPAGDDNDSGDNGDNSWDNGDNSWDNSDNSWDNGDNSWDSGDNSWDSGQWSGDNSGQWQPPTPKPTTQRPSGPTEPIPLQGPLSGDYKVVCYFTNWAWYRNGIGKYKPEDIDPTICTHIVYGFAVLDYSTLLMKPHDSWADIDNDFYGKVTEFKKYGIKVTVAIGGWNDSQGGKYSKLVNNPSARKRFIEHVIKFIEKYNFDGLDLDWEYPSCWQTECKESRYSDKDAFSAWVRELKEAFRPRGLLLSAAVSPSKKIMDVGYNVPSIARDLDWIAVMSYDYHGHWDKKTGHVSPFYEHPDDEFYYFNTNYTINYWIESGAPASKLVMGMPLYGQAFTLDKASQHGLNAPARQKGKAGEFTRAAGFLAYYEICRNIKRGGWTVVKDPEGRMGPYAYKDRQWVGYDDVAVIRRKSQYIRDMGLGGGMVWALDLDDFRNECGEGPHPLMNAIKEVLGPAKDAAEKKVEPVEGAMEDSKAEDEAVPGAELHPEAEEKPKRIPEPESKPEPEPVVETGISEEEQNEANPIRAQISGDGGYKVVCYFTNWAWYRPGQGKYQPEDIDPSLCTHIVYGFAVLDTRKLVVRAHDSWADYSNDFYKKVTSLKNKGKKVLLALGGWNDSAGNKYSRLVNSAANRKKFIEHAVDFITRNNFDGLDLDWEYPVCWQVDCKKGPASDKAGFAAWVRELSAALKPRGLLLSAAVSPSNKVMDAGYDIPVLSKYLDYVNVMTYDYHGQWDKKTGHVAPMYEHSKDDNVFFNVNYTVNYWLKGGLSPKKLIMGMPTYGQSFTLASASKNGLNSKTYGGGTAGPFTRARGFLAYYEICDNIMNKGWKVIQDPDGTMGPYAYKGTQWVSFDDATMIAHKTQYIKNMGLGGAMIWALDLDDFRNKCGCGAYPLLNTINNVLKGSRQVCNQLSGNYRLGDLELSPSPYSGCSKGNMAPVEGDCNSYYVCNNGEYQINQCPPGLHWNRDRCDWPENAKCSAEGLEAVQLIQEVDNEIGIEDESIAVEAVVAPAGVSSDTGMKVVCYFTNWAWYRQGVGKYKPEDIDPTLCTHVNYGFAVLDPSLLIMVPHDSWADVDNKFFEQVAALKDKGIVVSIALGGWNDSEGDKYSRLVNSPAARKRFIDEAVKFMEKWGFQGLDLDWEYPVCWQVDCSKGPASDKAGFAALVQELSAELKPRGWILSAAVSGSKPVMDAGYDIPILNQYLDLINVMTYDYHGHWDKKTGHVAPLYFHPEDEFDYFNVNVSMNHWVQSGASKAKLVMGMPMYGQSFRLADRQETGLNAAAVGRGQPGEFTRAGGFIAYYEICDKVKNEGWTVVQDPANRMGPYAFKGDQWVGFDDITMIRRKSEFVRDNGFGGGMIWALDLDDFRNRCACETYPLLKTINRVLRQYSVPDPYCDARPLLYNVQSYFYPTIHL